MWDILQKYSEEMAEGTFPGTLFDVGSYPAAILSDDNSEHVHGEVYRLSNSDALFRHLDPYEGYVARQPSKSLYLRKEVTVTIANTEQITAWVYLYNRPVDGLTKIPNGDYLDYLKE